MRLSERLAKIEMRRKPARPARDHSWNINLAAEVRKIITDPTNRLRAVELADRNPRLIKWAWQHCFGEPVVRFHDAIVALYPGESHVAI
jgi:hypothetical protein